MGSKPAKALMSKAAAYVLQDAARSLAADAEQFADVDKIVEKSDDHIDISDVLDSIKEFQEALEFYREHTRPA